MLISRETADQWTRERKGPLRVMVEEVAEGRVDARTNTLTHEQLMAILPPERETEFYTVAARMFRGMTTFSGWDVGNLMAVFALRVGDRVRYVGREGVAEEGLTLDSGYEILGDPGISLFTGNVTVCLTDNNNRKRISSFTRVVSYTGN
ncbi:MAG: hypothetical protein ABIH92_03210 [Nanoarchaeota archaeon]